MTAGKPTIRPSLKILLSGLFFSKNFKEAPMPRRTVEILCVAKATGNEISKSNNIAGSCIIPAPPPEKAEKRLETKDIKRSNAYSKIYVLRIMVPKPSSVNNSRSNA